MPIYEYRCPLCGQIQEVISLPGSPAEEIPCKTCGHPSTERVLSAHAAPQMIARQKGKTCCGRDERCSTPPCSTGGSCHRG